MYHVGAGRVESTPHLVASVPHPLFASFPELCENIEEVVIKLMAESLASHD